MIIASPVPAELDRVRAENLDRVRIFCTPAAVRAIRPHQLEAFMCDVANLLEDYAVSFIRAKGAEEPQDAASRTSNVLTVRSLRGTVETLKTLASVAIAIRRDAAARGASTRPRKPPPPRNAEEWRRAFATIAAVVALYAPEVAKELLSVSV